MSWIRRVRVAAVIALTTTTVVAFAKPKVKTYPQNCNQVWTAVKTATSSSHYNFAQLDDTQKKGLVSTGNTLTGKRYLDITLTSPTPDTCDVAVGGVFSGFAHDDKGDLFGRIEEALKTPAPSANPAAAQPKTQTATPSAAGPSQSPPASQPQTPPASQPQG